MTFPITLRHTTVALAATAALLGGCSSVDKFFGGDKVDYKTQTTKTAAPLEVPPDLTQLARDGRYRQQGSVVSASEVAGTASGSNPATAAGAAAAAAAPATQVAAAAVAPLAVGAMKVERDGTQRWLTVPMPPEQLWPQLQAFWPERGFTLEVDNAQTGVMETNWAENRANLPDDLIRRTLGKALDSLYSTGERDRYRTRVERTATGSEVYISHRGMQEIFVGTDRETRSTVWQPRASDPQLEAEFLSRLMVKLGAPADSAKTTVASAAEPESRARPAGAAAGAGAAVGAAAVSTATSLELDDAFDRAWRRVGLALDRSGFTVEDRDRTAGVYFVRYVDPASSGKEEPGFFARIFKSDDKTSAAPVRYRILVKTAGTKTAVSVQDSSGAADTSDNARRIVGLLVKELK